MSEEEHHKCNHEGDFEELSRVTSFIETLTSKNPVTLIPSDCLYWKRCWLQLGMCYSLKRNYEKSVFCFQKCVSLDHNDRLSWHVLGEAYFNLGNYISSMKAFVRTLDMPPTSPDYDKVKILNVCDDTIYYEEFRQAAVKSLLGIYNEPIHVYERLVKDNRNNLIPLLGLCFSKLLIVKEIWDSDRDKAIVYCGQILSDAVHATTLRPSVLLPHLVLALLFTQCLVKIPKEDTASGVILNGVEYKRIDLIDNCIQQICTCVCAEPEKSRNWRTLHIWNLARYCTTTDKSDLKKSVYAYIRYTHALNKESHEGTLSGDEEISNEEVIKKETRPAATKEKLPKEKTQEKKPAEKKESKISNVDKVKTDINEKP